MPLRKLNIGTYVAASPNSLNPVPADSLPNDNPYHPIATATLNTPVFDVVHMFSERSISAVPIIDENGIVVNLYETVDVIVSLNDILPCTYLTLKLHLLYRLYCGWAHTNLWTSLSPKHLTNVLPTSLVSLSAMRQIRSVPYYNSSRNGVYIVLWW